jgi:hypothetical protein
MYLSFMKKKKKPDVDQMLFYEFLNILSKVKTNSLIFETINQRYTNTLLLPHKFQLQKIKTSQQ